MASSEQSPLLSSSRSIDRESIQQPEDERSNSESTRLSKSGGFRELLVIISLGVLIFIQATNMSVLTTTQSAIAADLDISEEASWLTSSYLVAMSSVTPLMGRFNELFSPRLCISFSTIIVSIGCIIASIAPNFVVFIIGRVVSGTGTAGILVSITIIVVQRSSAKRRGIFLGLTNTGMTVGVSLGAVLAGALEPRIGWHALFGVQAPVSIITGLILYFNLAPVSPQAEDDSSDLTLKQKFKGIDYGGAFLLTATIVLLLTSLSAPKILVFPLVASFITFLLFLILEVSLSKRPIIPVTVLKSRGTLLSCIATVGLMMSRWVVLFYLPVYAIAVREFSPTMAGSILIPTNAGFAMGGVLVGWLHIRRDGSFFAPSLITVGLFPLTMFGIAKLSTPETPMGLYVLFAFFNGFSTGSALNYTLVHVLHLTYPATHAIVLSLLGTFRGFAGSFSSAIGGGLFTRILIDSLKRRFESAGLSNREILIRKLIGSPAIVANLNGIEKDIAIQGYVDAVQGLFLAAVILSTLVIFVQAGAGRKAPS